jgi:hypothetical protein
VSCDSGYLTLFLIGRGVRWAGETDSRPAGCGEECGCCCAGGDSGADRVVVCGRPIEKAGCCVGWVSRPTVDLWLSRYQSEGLAGLIDRSHAAPREQVSASIRARIWR